MHCIALSVQVVIGSPVLFVVSLSFLIRRRDLISINFS